VKGQCVNGKFVMTPCASTLQCAVLPLVNKSGTRYVPHHPHGFSSLTYRSITCDTQQDAEVRIANSSATGGLLGKREIIVRYVSFALWSTQR
jgi:hypothetical protein